MKTRTGLLIGILILVSLSCSLPGIAARTSEPLPPPAKPPAITAEAPQQATSAPIPTQPPAVEPTSVPPTELPPPAAPDVSYEGISFSYDKALAIRVDETTLPAVLPSSDTAPWDVSPETFSFSFQGYLLQGTFHKPQINVYRADEFARIDENAAGVINDMVSLLKELPEKVEYLPFLPNWNAAQVMQSNLQYLRFENGVGVRFLTQYGQDVSPINNHSVFYTFQGLTNDGKFYVSMIMPVNHPSLPASYDSFSQEDFNRMIEDYPGYLEKMEADLSQQPLNSFTPSLELLDKMVTTINIQK